jgi:hypothetical protein
MIDKLTYEFTADASGDLDTDFPTDIQGEVVKVQVEPGTAATTMDVTLSVADAGGGETIATLANVNTGAVAYPRVQAEDEAGADITYDGTRGVHVPAVVHGKLHAVVDEAGNGGTGKIHVYVRR